MNVSAGRSRRTASSNAGRSRVKSGASGTPAYLSPAKVAIILNMTKDGSTPSSRAPGRATAASQHLDQLIEPLPTSTSMSAGNDIDSRSRRLKAWAAGSG